MTRLEHIGLAVASPEEAAALYEALLGVRPYKQEGVAREGVRTHFISAETVKLELLEALRPDSPVGKYLEKRGEGLHHLAFEVDDAQAQLNRLRAAGFTPLSDTPRPGADGKHIFFLHPRQTHGVLIEFCQSVSTPFDATAVPFEGGHLAAYVRGDDALPAVLVLHDRGQAVIPDAEPLVRRLEEHFYVLACDLPGHGGSSAFKADDTGFHARAAHAVLAHLGVARACVFGVGYGGRLALRLASDAPLLVERAAVFGVPPLAEEDSFECPSCPVLVVAADRDPAAPPEAALQLHRTLPDARLAVLPGDGHAWPDARLLADLLRSHFA